MAKIKRSKSENELSNHSGHIENNPEVKSFIYQQINDFNPFVTPETVIMVVARDPAAEHSEIDSEDQSNENLSDYKHRIAIVLQEQEATLEAEAYHDDIFEAIKLAKISLIDRLVAIQREMESQKEFDFEIEEIEKRKSEPLH